MGIVDDLCEQNGLVKDQLWFVGFGIADKRKVEIRQHDEGGIYTASSIGNLKRCVFAFRRSRVASEDVEEQYHNGDDQRPRNNEF